MLTQFEQHLHAFADVLVHVGLNLQRGQRLLIAEPYELQGVARSAEVIVEAVRTSAAAAGGAGVEVIWGDGARLREYASTQDWHGFGRQVSDNAGRMQSCVLNGDALLFLQGSQPGLLAGIPAAQTAELHRIAWEHFGPIAQRLMQGATNWTAAPAPSPGWAHAVFGDLPSEQRLAALWETVFTACRTDAPDPREAWRLHLLALQMRRDELNARQWASLHYTGSGTDLRVSLPAGHRWCSAQLQTESGLPFVANLPTEEVFTLPHRDSAEGHVKVARPVVYGGTTIEGIELEFRDGCVTAATARRNANMLEQVLATDDGASRLGEAALTAPATIPWQDARRIYHHTLLDENALNHVALGESYPFCLREPDPAAANRSLLHVDLPLEAEVELS